MMIFKKLNVILIVLVWTGDSVASNHRSRRTSSETYILHRCTATAELIRKHRNEAVNSHKTEEDSSLSQIQRRNPDSVVLDSATLLDTSQSEIPSGIHRGTTQMKRHGIMHARRIAGKHLADTPLRTLHIDVPQDRPSAFKKKTPLPELSRDASGRKIDTSPHVIIIKPVT